MKVTIVTENQYGYPIGYQVTLVYQFNNTFKVIPKGKNKPEYLNFDIYTIYDGWIKNTRSYKHNTSNRIIEGEMFDYNTPAKIIKSSFEEI